MTGLWVLKPARVWLERRHSCASDRGLRSHDQCRNTVPSAPGSPLQTQRVKTAPVPTCTKCCCQEPASSLEFVSKRQLLTPASCGGSRRSCAATRAGVPLGVATVSSSGWSRLRPPRRSLTTITTISTPIIPASIAGINQSTCESACDSARTHESRSTVRRMG